MIVTFVTEAQDSGGEMPYQYVREPPTAEEADRLAAACEAPTREAGLLDVARHRPPCQRAVRPDLEGHPPLARATFRPNILAIIAPRIGFELMGMDRRGPPGEPGNCHCQIIRNYLLKIVIELDRPGV